MECIRSFWAKSSFVRAAFSIAVLGALLAAAPGAFAQHAAGGHFGGGHAGGFSGGGFHGGFSAPRSFGSVSSPRSFGSFAAPSFRGFAGAPRSWAAPRYNLAPQRGGYAGYRPSFGAENRRGRGDRGRYRPTYRGYGYGGYPYPYANSWELLPWDIGYPDFTGYGDDSDAASPNYAQAQPSGEEPEPPPQEYEGYQPQYPPMPYQAPAPQPAASTPPQQEPELTLIFKDGHSEVIRNYMITQQDVIVMDRAAAGRTPRIPLSALNLPATEQAARRNGLDFSRPSS